MRFHRTVSFRVLAGTLALLVLSLALLSFLIVRFYTARLEDSARQSAYRVSDFIVASTRHSMLQNRKQDVYEVMRTIAGESGVEGVRIYNKRGLVTYSTDAAEHGTMVDLHAEACVACHDAAKPLEALPSSERGRVYRAPGGARVVAVITPVRNEPGCSGPGCHSSPAQRPVLGVFDVRMSLAHVDRAITQARRRALGWTAAACLLVGTLTGLFLNWTVRRPIRALAEGTRQLSAGNLDYRIPIRSDDDLGHLAASFNGMTASLREAQDENRRWSRTLEERVRDKTEQLQRVHRQMMHVEKMASLGTLSASVAHELNNPLSAVLTYARLNARRLRREGGPPDLESVAADLDTIGREADRCGAICRNLLLFSRRESGEFHLASLGEVIARTLGILAHHLQMANVQAVSSCDPPDLTVVGDEAQLEQALVALCVNAAEAMPDGGTLRIAARRAEGGEVLLEVADSGTGISPQDLPHVFEPFFTTKPRGVGVGLGLAIVYGIVQRHGGSIDVSSEPGRGTTFTLRFPPPDAAPSRAPGARPENETRTS